MQRRSRHFLSDIFPRGGTTKDDAEGIAQSSTIRGDLRDADHASGSANRSGRAEADFGATGHDLVHVGQLLSGGGETHLQSLCFTVPALASGLFDSRPEIGASISTRRGRCKGSGRRSGQRMQLCSWISPETRRVVGDGVVMSRTGPRTGEPLSVVMSISRDAAE